MSAQATLDLWLKPSEETKPEKPRPHAILLKREKLRDIWLVRHPIDSSLVLEVLYDRFAGAPYLVAAKCPWFSRAGVWIWKLREGSKTELEELRELQQVLAREPWLIERDVIDTIIEEEILKLEW